MLATRFDRNCQHGLFGHAPSFGAAGQHLPFGRVSTLAATWQHLCILGIPRVESGNPYECCERGGAQIYDLYGAGLTAKI